MSADLIAAEPEPITTPEQMGDLLRMVALRAISPPDAQARIEAWGDCYARRAVLHERDMVAAANAKAQAGTAKSDLQKSPPVAQ